MRLGDLDALMEITEQQGHLTVDDILSAPTIDAVPVVRCKDCFWFMAEVGCPLSKSGYFKRGKPLPHENDFCSYGERKEAEGDG